MVERYIVKKETVIRLLKGIDVRRYFWELREIDTVNIDLVMEYIRTENEEWLATGTTNKPSIECEDVVEEHHDIYPITAMLIRSIGIPVKKYYLTELLLGTTSKSSSSSIYKAFKEDPLSELHLLRLISEML